MIAVIADIHGNLPALESVLSDIDKYKPDCIISLGDVSGYYPFINECVELLDSRNVTNILGNHDRYIIDNIDCPRSYSANQCLIYQRSVIQDDNRKWLQKSVPFIRLDDTLMLHGGIKDYEDEYIYKLSDSYFSKMAEKYCFCGHTHVQKKVLLRSGKVFINPGAVGQPRDGDPRAAYCLYDEKYGQVKLIRVSYNIKVVAEKMNSLGFEEKYYSNLYNGTRIGGKVDTISYGDIK